MLSVTEDGTNHDEGLGVQSQMEEEDLSLIEDQSWKMQVVVVGADKAVAVVQVDHGMVEVDHG